MNIDLVCGDPLLELQANAINTLSNTQIPGTNTWVAIIDWLNDFLVPLKDEYATIFLDCNPSFSIYTQIGLASVARLVLPVMADDSFKARRTERVVSGLRAAGRRRRFTRPTLSTRNWRRPNANCHRSI